MGMTIAQKILTARAGLESVEAGQLTEADLDLVLGNDITSPVAVKKFNRLNLDKVFSKDEITIVPNHFTPNRDMKTAEQCKLIGEFAREKGITNSFEAGEMGIEHCLVPERRLAVAGDVAIGADSHACTYGTLGAFSTGIGSTSMAAGMTTGKCWFRAPSTMKFVLKNKPSKWVSRKDVILHIIDITGVDGALYRSMKFADNGLKYLSIDDRFTMANVAIEADGKNGILPVDDMAIRCLVNHAQREWKVYEADEDAEYDGVYEIGLNKLRSTIAFPHLPDNTKTIDEVREVAVGQVVIGSYTNGRISDLRVTRDILKNKKVEKGVRCIVFPGTRKIYPQALEESIIKGLVEARAVVSAPTCGPCLGRHMRILVKGERAISTTSRNFAGRMGHIKSEVYLASPAIAAVSALTGRVTNPEEVGVTKE